MQSYGLFVVIPPKLEEQVAKMTQRELETYSMFLADCINQSQEQIYEQRKREEEKKVGFVNDL